MQDATGSAMAPLAGRATSSSSIEVSASAGLQSVVHPVIVQPKPGPSRSGAGWLRGILPSFSKTRQAATALQIQQEQSDEESSVGVDATSEAKNGFDDAPFGSDEVQDIAASTGISEEAVRECVERATVSKAGGSTTVANPQACTVCRRETKREVLLPLFPKKFSWQGYINAVCWDCAQCRRDDEPWLWAWAEDETAGPADASGLAMASQGSLSVPSTWHPDKITICE